MQPQAHHNFPLNVYHQQNSHNLSIMNHQSVTPNFNIQQIQIASLNVQPIIFPEPSLNINKNVVIQQQQPLLNLAPQNNPPPSYKPVTPQKGDTIIRHPQSQEKKSPLKEEKTSPIQEDDMYLGGKPSKESLSTTSNSDQNEIEEEEEPKSAESFMSSSVTINLRNSAKKSPETGSREKKRQSIAEILNQKDNQEDKTKSSKELDKIIQRQTKEELAFVTRRRENLERRKNRWQIAQEEEKPIIEKVLAPEPEPEILAEQKIIKTPIGRMNQVQLPSFFEEDVIRSRVRDSQLKWNPEAIKPEEFEGLVLRVMEILKMNHVNNEKLTRLLRQNDFDMKKTIEMIQENTKRYVQFFMLRQKKLKIRY